MYSLVPAPVDALGVSRQVAEAQTRKAMEKDLGIEILVDGAPPSETATLEVMGEELLVYLMLSNLLANAVEASPPGMPVVMNLSQRSGRTISIHNRGCIPPEIQPRFMQKFVTFGKEDGTGLGAYSARLIARTLGGDIDFSSSPEEGTTVTVRLP